MNEYENDLKVGKAYSEKNTTNVESTDCSCNVEESTFSWFQSRKWNRWTKWFGRNRKFYCWKGLEFRNFALVACTHPSDYLLVNFFNKDVVWDAGFLEVFFGEVDWLDYLIHMCLMLCTKMYRGQSSRDELQKSLLLERGISMICLPLWSEVWLQICACVQALQWLEELWWKQNRPSCCSPEQAWVCTLSKPVSGLAVRGVILFFFVSGTLWYVNSVDGSWSKWERICFSVNIPRLVQSLSTANQVWKTCVIWLLA